MSKYHIYTDAGHGWLKVKKQELLRLRIDDKITHYSYQRGQYAYLEEDCDLPTFVNAKNAVEEVVEYISHHSSKSSKIRSYDCYLPLTF